jgi:HSP20 family protein
MAIVRWFPFQEMDSLERRMRRMLDDVGMSAPALPAADLYETEGEFVVELEVPGFDQPELAIEVHDHTLTVTGERKAEKEEQEKSFYLHERLERAFQRRFALPANADTQKVTAEFGKGVLKVHAPKVEVAQPRTIEIGAGS